jgi:Protein of unknown function (DUF3379)
MMDCAQYRRAVLADPHDANPELALHLASCADCPQYTERLLRFEGRLERALRVGPAAQQPPRSSVLPFAARWARRANPRWFAMAASFLIAVVIAGTLWIAAPRASLAADVVAHMAGEPDAWAQTDVPVPPEDLAKVLDAAHVRLKSDAGMVSYAQSCLFRGHHVPHLVVQTEAGPVTVMVLAHESVSKPRPFDEEGYRGVILPAQGHGSLAVLSRGRDLQAVEKVAARVQRSVDWTG